MFLQVCKGIESQIVVKSLLIVPVASLDLAVVPRRSWSDQLMLDLVMVTEYIKGMYALGFGEMGKFCSVVGLNFLRRITEESDCTLDKVYGGVVAVFFIGIYKPLSRRFFEHGVLIEFPTVFARITDLWNEFNAHLPLDTIIVGVL